MYCWHWIINSILISSDSSDHKVRQHCHASATMTAFPFCFTYETWEKTNDPSSCSWGPQATGTVMSCSKLLATNFSLLSSRQSIILVFLKQEQPTSHLKVVLQQPHYFSSLVELVLVHRKNCLPWLERLANGYVWKHHKPLCCFSHCSVPKVFVYIQRKYLLLLENKGKAIKNSEWSIPSKFTKRSILHYKEMFITKKINEVRILGSVEDCFGRIYLLGKILRCFPFPRCFSPRVLSLFPSPSHLHLYCLIHWRRNKQYSWLVRIRSYGKSTILQPGQLAQNLGCLKQ